MTTIVTALFQTNRASIEQYLDHAKKFTLKIPCNMIIFTEPNNFQTILQIRKEYDLENVTKIINICLSELKLYNQLDKLTKMYEEKKDNDKVKPYSPKYSIIVNSKFELLEKSIRLNPFKTKTFIWIDIGLHKRGYSYNDITINYLTKIIKIPKTKVSYAIIDPNFDHEQRNLDGWLWIAAGGIISLTIHDLSFLKICQEFLFTFFDKNIYCLEEYILFYIWKNNLYNVNIFFANYNTLLIKYYGDYPMNESKKPP